MPLPTNATGRFDVFVIRHAQHVGHSFGKYGLQPSSRGLAHADGS